MNEMILEIKKYVSELKIPGVNQGLKMSIEEAYKFDKSYEEFLRELKFHDHVISAPKDKLSNNLPKQSWYDTASGVVIMSPIYKDTIVHNILNKLGI